MKKVAAASRIIALLMAHPTIMEKTREFLFILRFRNYNPETNEVQTGISRMTKLLKDAGFSYRQASKEDIKRLYAVYFVQNITQVYFDDYDGERFVKGDGYC